MHCSPPTPIPILRIIIYPCTVTKYVYTAHGTCVGLMLDQRRRRWPNIKPAQGQYVFIAMLFIIYL